MPHKYPKMIIIAKIPLLPFALLLLNDLIIEVGQAKPKLINMPASKMLPPIQNATPRSLLCYPDITVPYYICLV